jgi:PAS domain S-box-containing protein
METTKIPLRILLVEDNENDGALIIRYLAKSDYEIFHIRVETATDMRSALEQRTWDIVISDYSLPQFNALAALRILQETGIDIPFIVVSGTIGEETAVEMMRSGAQDYLMKNNLTRLIPAITRELSDAKVRREHKYAEHARHESETKFRVVFENSVDAIGISLNGIHVFVNPAFTLLFGYSDPGEILGLPIINLIAPEERGRILDFVRRRPSDPSTPGEYETSGVKKDGTKFDMEVRVSLLEINNEINTLVIIRDITLRKKAEAQLLEAKQKVEESSLIKSTLMMNMSHEVRTPMNAILGFSSIICNESEEEEIRLMADRIRISGNRLMKTLDDILELTQLQSGIESVEVDVANLEQELSAIVHSFAAAASKKGLKMEFHLEGKIDAFINRSLFIKAIGEILLNSIKFTSNGGINVELLSQIIAGESMAVIRIADTGIGIAKEYHSAIFDSFRQVSGGYGRSFEGTGLGLTIAKKIVELMKGEIFVESESGKGSVFTIKLPCISGGAMAAPETAVDEILSVDQPGTVRMRAGKPKILLVEDNEDNIFVTREYLKEYYEVDSAVSEAEALENVEKNNYELILMDINLGPGKNGLEVTREIRKNKNHHRVPVIALTGLTFREDKHRLLAGGCDYFLGKPFTKKDLLALVDKVLSPVQPSP